MLVWSSVIVWSVMLVLSIVLVCLIVLASGQMCSSVLAFGQLCLCVVRCASVNCACVWSIVLSANKHIVAMLTGSFSPLSYVLVLLVLSVCAGVVSCSKFGPLC